MKINEGNSKKDSNSQSSDEEDDVMDKYNENQGVQVYITQNKFICYHEGCGQRFSSNYRLKIHIQTHVT